MSNPKLLLLDEPSLGLSPVLADRIFELIQEIRKMQVSILLVEQNAIGALAISDRGYVIENGRIVLEGKSSDLLQDPTVQGFYLGGMSGESSQGA